MDNVLIKCLEKTKKDLIMNIYENNADTSIDRKYLCTNSLHCIDDDCLKDHYVDINNRKIIMEIIDTLDVQCEDDVLETLSKEIKDDLKEIKEIELYLDKLRTNVNEKKLKVKELIKLI